MIDPLQTADQYENNNNITIIIITFTLSHAVLPAFNETIIIYNV